MIKEFGVNRLKYELFDLFISFGFSLFALSSFLMQQDVMFVMFAFNVLLIKQLKR